MANIKQTNTERRKRTPVGGPKNILTVANQDPNYVYRFVNSSIPGRIQRFIDGGYDVVPNEDVVVGDNVVDRGTALGSATSRAGGGGVILVLMRILREWYEEDQAAKQESIDELEQAQFDEAHKGMYGKYQPMNPRLAAKRK